MILFRKFKSLFMNVVIASAALIVTAPVFLILYYLIKNGIDGLSLEFFKNLPKPVGEPGGGMANAMLGSITMLLISLVIAVPWGIGVGLYLHENTAYPFAKIVRYLTDLLMSIPSIVVGLFVYVVAVKPFGGFSAWAGGLALAIIMLPIVVRTTEEIIKLIPPIIKEAGLGLGIPRWRVMTAVVMRGCLGALVTSLSLAASRILGETAPLLFTSFNNQYWASGLSQPMASLPVQIFTYAISPFEEWQRLAWAGALVLISSIFTVNLVIRVWFLKKRSS